MIPDSEIEDLMNEIEKVAYVSDKLRLFNIIKNWFAKGEFTNKPKPPCFARDHGMKSSCKFCPWTKDCMETLAAIP